jgi:AraC-like DNA-binding protein
MHFPTDGIQHVRASSDAGRIEMSLRAPVAPLRDFVRGYCLYEEERAQAAEQQHLPHRDVTLILSLDGALEVRGPGEGRQLFGEGEGFLAGIHTRPAVTSSGPRQRGIQISLTPIGAHRLLGGRPMDEVSDRTCSLDALMGRSSGELAGRLDESRCDPDPFATLDRFFGERMLGARTVDPHVLAAWRWLEASHGSLRIAEIAARLGWSRKRLVARFREQIGHPPKTIARVLRFDRAMQRLREDPEVQWSDVALSCGYADQSHLNHEVREFSGQTPMELAARVIPESGGVAAA